MLKVTFIQHSCVLIELDKKLLLFDYFPAGCMYDKVQFHGSLPEFPEDKRLYVFATHSHKDHFSLDVLKWKESRPDITYILSKDIRLGRNYLVRNGIDPEIKRDIHFVSPVERYEIDDLVIETLRSNDAGVAFVVEAEGQAIYHSGDLNWWNFGIRDELYGEKYAKEYKRELSRIKERHIDLAFVVLDPRLGDGYALGAEYFVNNIDADLIFPIHMWGDYSKIEQFKHRPKVVRFADRIVDIDRENIVFEIES